MSEREREGERSVNSLLSYLPRVPGYVRIAANQIWPPLPINQASPPDSYIKIVY